MAEETPAKKTTKMTYRIIGRRWPFKKTRYMWMFMLLELIVLVPNLILHALAHPDTWRTAMWEIGFEHGWNSDPRMVLYAAANYRPEPTVSFVWTKTLTLFNVAITIVTLFTLLLRMIFFIMKIYYPIIAVFFHVGLVAIWTVSVYGQMGPDYADPRFPSKIAWYITRSCDAAGGRFRAVKECTMAKAAFAISVVMLAVFVANLGIALWGMWPNEVNNRRRRSATNGYDSDSDNEDASDNEEDASSGGSSPIDPKAARQARSGTWEMKSMSGGLGGNPPLSPRVTVQPYTPRTLAFHTLDRKLPLRQQDRWG